MSQPQPAGSPARAEIGSNAEIAALLQRIDERLARVERAALRAESAAGVAPAIVATAVDTFDALAARAPAGGMDLDERLSGGLRLG